MLKLVSEYKTLVNATDEAINGLIQLQWQPLGPPFTRRSAIRQELSEVMKLSEDTIQVMVKYKFIQIGTPDPRGKIMTPTTVNIGGRGAL